MALKGNLRDFSITQLLNLINLAKKSGMLLVEGSGEAARIHFKDGKLVHIALSGEDNSLAAVLKRNNKITANQFRILQARAGQSSDKELGLLLINAGYLSQDDILLSIQSSFTATVRRLFTWVDGLFSFEPGALPPAGKITTRMDLENLIIEGSRQMREWEQLHDEIPSLDMALKFSERPGTNIKNLHLNTEEWRVISYVNPKNTLRQIARTVQLNEVDIRRVVYGLLSAGLVELVRPAAAVPAVPAVPLPASPTKEQRRGLVRRLIDRIRSI